MSDDLDLERIAKLSEDFQQTEFGEWFMMTLSELYQGKHHAAEAATSVEQIAMLVQQAAGIHEVIDIIMKPVVALKSGLLDEPDDTEETDDVDDSA